MPYKESQKLLVLLFFRDFIYNDYRGLLSKEDYHTIESALDCLWGSSCLIPYPDYLKMGKLRLGDTTEIGYRLKNIENTKVMKAKSHITDVPDIGLNESVLVNTNDHS